MKEFNKQIISIIMSTNDDIPFMEGGMQILGAINKFILEKKA